MPHFFASNLRAVALPARTKNFEFIFEAKSLRDESAIIFAKSLAKSLHGEQKILLSKQKKGARFLVKFNKHFSAHSKEIIKSALKEYAELAGAEIVAHNLSENKIRVDSAYMLDWREICALLGGNSSLDLHSADFANLGRFADFSPVSHLKFAKNHESQTENPSVVDSANLSNSQNLNKNNPRVSANLESRPLRGAKNRIQASSSASADFLLEAEKRGSPPKSEKRQLLGTHFKRVGGSGAGGAALLQKESKLSGENGDGSAESSLDSAELQNLQGGLSRASARNDKSILDSAPSTQEANSSIFDEKSGLCSCERENRTNGSLTKRATNLPDLSQKDEEFAMLEIGFGSGRHILHLAQKHPSAKIIGLEIYRPAISQVLRQIEILGLQNLYLASIDARVLCEVLPAKCLNRIYLHFPVPWDKNPQRRVLSAQFLGNAMRAIKDDGFFELLTDSAEYFAFAKTLAKGYKFKAEEGAKGEVVSKYEARWRRQEKVIYRIQIFSNSVLGMQFRTCENFGESTDSSLVLSPKFSQIQKPHRNHFDGCFASLANPADCDSLCESTANQTKIAESTLDSANLTPFSPTKICKKEYFLHIKNKYIFEGGVVLFASFGAYYAPSSAYFVICGNEVSTISEIVPTRANIDALGLFMELCFDN